MSVQSSNALRPESITQPSMHIPSPLLELRQHETPTRNKPVRPNRHTDILIDATRQFSLAKRPPREEIDRYKELFYQLIDRLEIANRRLISAMLARSSYAPRAVALYMAQDALEVAAPFLLFSPVLTDLDLRAIAGKRGKIYADLISKRQIPMEPFTARKLRETPVSGNHEASPTATESPKPLSKEPSAWQPQSEILDMAATGGRLGRNKSSATEPKGLSEGAPKRPLPFKLPRRECRELMQLARNQDREGFAQAVELLIGLEAKAVLKLLKTETGEEPLYLIKALGVVPPHDLQMALMIQPRFGRTLENYHSAKRTLGALDPGICRIIFNEIGARFDVDDKRTSGANIGTTRQETAASHGFHEAVQNRRKSVAANHMPSDQKAPPVRQLNTDGLSGLAPMSRWPGSETGLREAV